MDYGKTIRKRREQLGLTQAQLAKRSGVDQTIISRMEAGRRKIISSRTRKVLVALGLEMPMVPVDKRR